MKLPKFFFFYYKNRCIATNKYSTKPTRSQSTSLHIIPASNKHMPKLLPPLQNRTIMILTGKKLRLICAPDFSTTTTNVKWSFTPRYAPITVNSSEHNGTELRIFQVSSEHDGIYNCSYSGEYQVRSLI